MKLETKFSIGQDVQLATDDEKRKRRIIKIVIFDKGYMEYLLCVDVQQSWHSECEIEPYEEPEKKPAGFGSVNKNKETPSAT